MMSCVAIRLKEVGTSNSTQLLDIWHHDDDKSTQEQCQHEIPNIYIAHVQQMTLDCKAPRKRLDVPYMCMMVAPITTPNQERRQLARDNKLGENNLQLTFSANMQLLSCALVCNNFVEISEKMEDTSCPSQPHEAKLQHCLPKLLT